MVGEPVRLPPPPFWRTAYFANEVMLRQDRLRITAEMILDVLATPVRTQRQVDGRYRHWGWSRDLDRWLRVVTLDDGETVHNAFLDRRFEP